MGNQREHNGWLGTMLRRSPATPADACLDAETLAAWADGGLTVKEAAAVELHASNCSRCMAVLATMERTAPISSATHAWPPARLFRWLVPAAAAAMAIAIWVAVPDRPIVPVQPAPAHDMSTSSELGTVPTEPGAPNPEPEAELRADAPSVRQEESSLRDDVGRERAAPEALGATAGRAAAAAPPPAVPAPAASADTLAESVTAAPRRSAFANATIATESVSPSNPSIRWRIVGFTSVERSGDGGKTWTTTTVPPGVAPNNTPAVTLVAVRAVDGSRAVVRTSAGTELYTTDGGLSWTRVQENSAAPF